MSELFTTLAEIPLFATRWKWPGMSAMTKSKKSKVHSHISAPFHAINAVSVAVTLEGTIIHKSGLITGGRSSHGNNKTWSDVDIQGK